MKKKRQQSSKPLPATKIPVDPAVWQTRSVATLCFLGFLVYANAFTASFQWDDFAVIVSNPAIRHVWDLKGLFDAFNTRFLVGWTLAVNYSFSQLNVVGYHFVNIWFHVCNAVLVYALSHQISFFTFRGAIKLSHENLFRSLGAALIFLLHPLATQPVNYIWQRSTLMVTFFYLATVVLFLEYRRTFVKGMLVGSLTTCFLAMLTKENAFVLPFMVITVDRLFFQSRQSTKKIQPGMLYLGFIMMMAIVPLLLMRTEHLSLNIMKPYSMTRGVSENVISRTDYVLTQIRVWVTYLRLFVFPVGQSVDHDYPLVGQSSWAGWSVAFLFHLGVLWAGFYFLKRNRIVTFVVIWFYLNLILESVVTSRDLCVEHRMYLPMVGLCLLASFGIVTVLAQRNWRPASLFLGIVAIILGWATVHRNTVWQEPFSLWNDAVEKSPMKARPLNHRGQILRQVGQIDLALEDYNRAIALDPQFAAAYQNRGNIFKLKGNVDRAFDDYSQVIRLEPTNAQAYASRGNIYKRKGEFALALQDYSMAVQMDSTDEEIYANRGYLQAMLKNYDEAFMDYQRALQINPQYISALNNRGNLNIQLRNYQAAIKDYTQAINIQPGFAEAYANRAVAYFQQGLIEESNADVQKAQQLGQKMNENFVRQLNEHHTKNINH